MTTPVMKCTKLSDLLALPAVMLGFHPTESCVFIGMRGKSVGFIARADLNWHEAGAEELIAQMRFAAGQSGASDWILLGYSADADLACLSVSEAAAAVGAHLVREALVTDGTLYWSLDNGEPEQFDFESSAVAAQAVYEGKVIAADRDAVLRAVEERCPADAETVAAQWARVRAARHPDRLLGRLLVPPTPLSDDEALQLALMLSDDVTCSKVASVLDVDVAADVWPQLAAAHRVAPEDLEAGSLAALALASWLRGGGAEYTACLEQLIRRAPTHPVTGVLKLVHQHGIPPKRWSERE